MESWGIAIILGIVEGLTEFLPVSSTGHLIVVGNLLGFIGHKASTFEVAIQLGAILAVVVLYHERFLGLIFNHRNRFPRTASALEGWSGLSRIALATLPALVAGYLAHDFIKAHLFTPATVALALALGGVGILIAESIVRRLPSGSVDRLTLPQALSIGLFQTLSLWPGISRSAATIVGGLLVGLDRKGAAEFSFLIAVPIMIAATGYDLLKMWALFTPDDVTRLAVGFGVSFLVATLSMVAFIRFLSRWSMAPFAWYRIVAAPVFYLLSYGRSLLG